ncbi:MAG TPA: hypothetical protein VI387_12430 [Candidatus Brocadiales bacterium]|nr:hypothetical protein [Candidatus Brocadiales bacterium]
MISKLRTTTIDHNRKKMERLAFIKERYRKLILEPRREIEFEIEKDLDYNSDFEDLPN